MTVYRKDPHFDDNALEIHGLATLHDGIVPVPLLAQTWVDRGAAYWCRRFGAVLLYLFFLSTSGLFTAADLILIRDDLHHTLTGVIGWIIFGVLIVVGFAWGVRSVRRAPVVAFSRVAILASPLIFLTGPAVSAWAVVWLLCMFGRDYPGERKARAGSKLGRNPATDVIDRRP